MVNVYIIARLKKWICISEHFCIINIFYNFIMKHFYIRLTKSVQFKGMYWQKWNIISMFSLVYNYPKIRILVFRYHIIISLYQHTKRSFSPCLCNSLEKDAPNNGSIWGPLAFSHVLLQTCRTEEASVGCNPTSPLSQIEPTLPWWNV